MAHPASKKQQAFNDEILPHLDSLYNFALRLTTDQSDAEDLVQDTIVKAFRFCLLYTSPSPRDRTRSRMPSSA